MNVLVLGGAGFIGSHLCERLLRAGHAVWAFDNLNKSYDPRLKLRNIEEIRAQRLKFEFVEGDITDALGLLDLVSSIRFDQIVHLAGSVGVRDSLDKPALYQRVNVEGTVNVLEAARKYGVQKITIASSASVYGANSKVPFCETDSVSSTISPYAASKLACESLGHVWHRNYRMDVAILRLFTAYGPRQRPNLAFYSFLERIIARKPISIFGDGGSVRDYTFISDIVAGICACIVREIGFEIFNIGASQPVTLLEVVRLLEQETNAEALINYLPMQAGDMLVTSADISKARTKLGYNPQVSIQQGIRLFVKWYLEQSKTLNFPLNS